MEVQSEGKKESGMNSWKCGMTEACINSSECAMIWQLKGRYVVFQTIKAEVIIYSIHGSILLESASSESLLFWGSTVCL